MYTQRMQADAAYQQLLATRYGVSQRRGGRRQSSTVSATLSADSGTQILKPPAEAGAPTSFEEYVVERGEPPVSAYVPSSTTTPLAPESQPAVQTNPPTASVPTVPLPRQFQLPLRRHTHHRP